MTGIAQEFRGEAGLLLAHGTIYQLADLAIPPTPANYEVWTAYRSGAFPDLNRDIEARLKSGEDFTDDFNRELFERYFEKADLSVQMVEAGQGIARELAGVLSDLRGVGVQTQSYAGELNVACQRMDRGVSPADFAAIVARLSAMTRSMAHNNRALEDRMEAASREIESLRTSLQNVRVEALTDSLTGLANRKHFDQALLRRLADAAGEDLCLLMCDIDHFKRVNDSYGHQMGDQVIRFVASMLGKHVRDDSLAARFGGEEFAVLMPRTSLSAAEAQAEEIRHAVRTKTLSQRSTRRVLNQVTLSIGVAKYRAPEGADAFLERADACLYQSKAGGRDRVTLETSLSADCA